ASPRVIPRARSVRGGTWRRATNVARKALARGLVGNRGARVVAEPMLSAFQHLLELGEESGPRPPRTIGVGEDALALARDGVAHDLAQAVDVGGRDVGRALVGRG